MTVQATSSQAGVRGSVGWFFSREKVPRYCKVLTIVDVRPGVAVGDGVTFAVPVLFKKSISSARLMKL